VRVAAGQDIVQVGSMIGDHRLLRKLGEGAMGTVYEAVHALIGKRVAIKVLKGVTDEGGVVAAKRLIEEARAVNAIQHKGIIDIFDAGLLSDGRPYLVMELLVGRSLHEAVKRTKTGLALRQVFHILEGILSALDAAHRAGVIHRDLKASNVFLVEQAQGLPAVKLVDFGVARRRGRSEQLTMPSMTVGSIGFMAPEHLGGKPVAQSDLYACGCLAWLMLTGKPVFPYGNPGALIQQHLSERPRPVGQFRKDVPPELEAFVAWMLEKRVDDRPLSAEVALTVLREAEEAGDVGKTAPGGPAFIELAKGYDARARRDAMPVQRGRREERGAPTQSPAEVNLGDTNPADTVYAPTPVRETVKPEGPSARWRAASSVGGLPIAGRPVNTAPRPAVRQPKVLTATPISAETTLPPGGDRGTDEQTFPSVEIDVSSGESDEGTVLDPVLSGTRRNES
jgi:serine/threonine-protein kinase